MKQQKKSMWSKLRRAFTITELVIVIAVIAILAAILIPTFSNVVDNSKKSADEQFARQINVALSNYSSEHNGAVPADYEELMLALNEYDLCDMSNPFLLATPLKQENYYLVWYRNANSVVLLDSSESSNYVLTWTGSEGLGNAVTVYDKGNVSNSSIGYVLCTDGDPRTENVATLCYEFYITSGGDINDFFKEGGYGESILNQTGSLTTDVMFGNAIHTALNNQKNGYTYSESIANELLQNAATSNSLNIGVSANTVDKAKQEITAGMSEEEKNAITTAQTQVRTNVLSGLATLASLANDAQDAEALQSKTIAFVENGGDNALEGIIVNMSDISVSSIGTTYRKDYSNQNGTELDRSSFSTNFQGVTLVGMDVDENTYISSGAELQDGGDSGYGRDSYLFTYGLFGTVNAEPGQTVTISNLNIEDVDLDLNGASETIGGQKYDTITDMAGVVVGYTQGNVVLENINISGKDLGNGEYGSISGYDGVAAVVGRAYGHASGETDYNGQLVFRNVHVRDLNVKGQRRAAGFLGFASLGTQVVIENSSLTNVHVSTQRSDSAEAKNMFTGIIGDLSGSDVSLTLNGVTLTDVSCDAKCRATESDPWIEIEDIKDGGFLNSMCYMMLGDEHLPLVYGLPATTVGTNGFVIVDGDTTYTYSGQAWPGTKGDMTSSFTTGA